MKARDPHADQPAEIIGQNVSRLRRDRALSQDALADKVGISRLSLGKIERGLVTPRSRTISALAQALDASTAELVTPIHPLRGVRFRARRRVNSREQILGETAVWLAAYNWLEQELGAAQPFALEVLVGSAMSPEELAAKARATLNVGPSEPIRDVCGLLEENGVKMLMLDKASDVFFGLSVGTEDGGPAVVVNTWERISVERWIFTALHELGHILMHMGAYRREESEEIDSEERAADRFASHFLMPADAFRKEWDDAAGHAFVDRVFKLKRIFRVSYKTVLYRLRESGLLGPDVFQVFQQQYKRRTGRALRRIDEPEALEKGEFRFNWSRAGELGDALSKYDFVSDRLARLVRQALDKEVISFGRAAEILKLSLPEMRELASEWVR